MKGRPPKPAALRALDGGASHRAKRDDRCELTLPAGCPEPPAHMSPGAKHEWFRVISYLQQVKGLLSPGDAAAVGIYASYYDQWQQAEERHPALEQRVEELEDTLDNRKLTKRDREALERTLGRVRNRYNLNLGQRNKARREMRAYLTELGLTPAARARIRVPTGQGELSLGDSDPFAAARATLSNG